MSTHAEQLSEPRRRIVSAIKRRGTASMNELASLLDLSGEAVRQHLLQLEKDGFISRFTEKKRGIGRPQIGYRLTNAGEHLFDKNYDHLTTEVLDTLVNHLGENTLKQVLTVMVEERIREWEPKLEGLTTIEKLNVLKDFYAKDDHYMEVAVEGDSYYLIERNCPFHNVAIQRPILCSITVSVLTRLLGCSVKRKHRLQNGDGCCTFLVQLDQPIDENTPILIIEDEPPKFKQRNDVNDS